MLKALTTPMKNDRRRLTGRLAIILVGQQEDSPFSDPNCSPALAGSLFRTAEVLPGVATFNQTN